MDAIKTYGNVIKKYTSKDPIVARNMIKTGLVLEHQRVKNFPERDIPRAYQYLNVICVKFIREALNNPEQSAWINLFAPAEILHAMDIKPLLMEAFSSFMSGFMIEDCLIDYSEKCGIAETLCSYHRTFMGAADAGILPKPQFAVTTSIVCDANINTFRHVTGKYKIPCYIIDVPYEYSKEGEAYVVNQLKEMVKMIENVTGKKLDEDKLKEMIKRENETRTYMKRYFKSLRYKNYPSTLTLQMYKLFTSHAFIGKEETYNFYKMLSEEIERYPDSKALRIFWVHLIPFYHETLRKYFNLNNDYQLLGYDFELDYIEEMDYNHPYEALAKKMINNLYNGKYERKIEGILDIIDGLKPDGVVNFCHWGCKQSSGGIMLLKEALKSREVPLLILDGDGIDRRNSHNGQVETRLEAFFEIIKKQKEQI